MTGAALGRGDGGVDRRVYNRPSGIASVFPQFLVAEVCFNEFSIGLCGFRLRTKTVIGHLITINPDVNPSWSKNPVAFVYLMHSDRTKNPEPPAWKIMTGVYNKPRMWRQCFLCSGPLPPPKKMLLVICTKWSYLCSETKCFTASLVFRSTIAFQFKWSIRVSRFHRGNHRWKGTTVVYFQTKDHFAKSPASVQILHFICVHSNENEPAQLGRGLSSTKTLFVRQRVVVFFTGAIWWDRWSLSVVSSCSKTHEKLHVIASQFIL